MRTALVSVFVALATAAFSSPTVAKSSSSIVSDAWEARQARYSAEYSFAEDRFKAAASSLSRALGANDPSFGPALEELISSSTAMGYADGRLGAIMSLRKLMATKPKETSIELWQQDQADALKRRSENASAQLRAALAQGPGQNGATANSQLQALTLAYIVVGKVNGTADELLLIHANLGTFLTAKNGEDQRRRAALASLSQALSDYGRNLAAIRPPASWSATCSAAGGFTHCKGQ